MPPKPGAPACQGQACALQSCLNKNTYSPEKCESSIRDLYKCCAVFYASTNDEGESTACPMPSVTRRWLKAHIPDSG
ncbi:hypothetical protein PHLGIDRAFT_29262 [Phlebiopsis gigantea 11061_1 CR5-6]|uniref:Cx9C motif-containing protein 4, mitochondrial n=1 Tax=Phlebiopsis gigantea (strain 11061_1 CR5-6) TaxID=745531 RepID=A0A0C3SCQ3_PHLG1|nr:hypothetical protein PHLGIDRAFT_29262 [Phlebiopsis gigantea 11061_1 CR5-6]